MESKEEKTVKTDILTRIEEENRRRNEAIRKEEEEYNPETGTGAFGWGHADMRLRRKRIRDRELTLNHYEYIPTEMHASAEYKGGEEPPGMGETEIQARL